MRNKVFRYYTWSLTCSGFAKTKAASSSANLSCNSSRLFLLYFALRRKGGANVDNSLNFAALTVVLRDGGVEHVTKLQIESYEFVMSVLI